MKALRDMVGDRWSGGMIAVLTAAFVLLQALVAGWTCAATLRASGDPLTVICHGAGVTAVALPAPGEPRADPEHNCPCGIMCGVGVIFAIPSDGDLGVAYAFRDGVDYDAEDSAATLVPGAIGTPLFPTGPPSASA